MASGNRAATRIDNALDARDHMTTRRGADAPTVSEVRSKRREMLEKMASRLGRQERVSHLGRNVSKWARWP